MGMLFILMVIAIIITLIVNLNGLYSTSKSKISGDGVICGLICMVVIALIGIVPYLVSVSSTGGLIKSYSSITARLDELPNSTCSCKDKLELIELASQYQAEYNNKRALANSWLLWPLISYPDKYPDKIDIE